jgi:Fic family protein
MLSEDEVRDIIDGKNVVAPIREIQEVKNAIKTYELYPALDAFKEKDLLKAHGVMMQALVDDAGHYRKGGVGVFGEKGLVHMAPPAERVPMLMADLFNWLKYSKDHLLIRSCVFHYEFEFIHPFIDGNGRTGRLWQSLILGRLNPIFEHLPVENMVYSHQQEYYDAIEKSRAINDSTIFIDFMLQNIYDTLKARQGEKLPDVGDNVGDNVGENVGENVGKNVGKTEQKIMALISKNQKLTIKEIADKLGISRRQGERIIADMRDEGLIRRIGSARGGYWEIC